MTAPADHATPERPVDSLTAAQALLKKHANALEPGELVLANAAVAVADGIYGVRNELALLRLLLEGFLPRIG